MVNKFVLDSIDLTDDFYEDAKLFGISSSIRDFRLILQLNKLFGFWFRCRADMEIALRRRERDYYFSVFFHQLSNTNTTFYLYNNGNDGEYLLPELKMMDFILLIKGGGFQPTPEQYAPLINAFKNLNSVRLISEVNVLQIQSKANLMF